MISGSRVKSKVAPYVAKWQAASDVNRLAILYLLVREPVDVSTLKRQLHISGSLLSHHLTVLLKAGWVTRSKYGKVVTYFLADGALPDAVKILQAP